MQKQWIAWVVLAGVLALCPAVEAGEQISAKLLEEARAKAANKEEPILSAPWIPLNL